MAAEQAKIKLHWWAQSKNRLSLTSLTFSLLGSTAHEPRPYSGFWKNSRSPTMLRSITASPICWPPQNWRRSTRWASLRW